MSIGHLGDELMLDHLEITVANVQNAERFYLGALAPLDYRLHVTDSSRGFGTRPDALDFWIKPGSVAAPLPHFAFQCRSRALVRAAYQQALESGGRDNGKPSQLPHIHANYYAAFVLDPDGHNVEFVCHLPE